MHSIADRAEYAVQGCFPRARKPVPEESLRKEAADQAAALLLIFFTMYPQANTPAARITIVIANIHL